MTHTPPPSRPATLGNGKFELADIGELAGKTMDAANRQLRDAEIALLLELRKVRRQLRQQRDPHRHDTLSFGQRLADAFAATMGSWKFIIIQSLILIAWVTLNVIGWIKAWDPYPFILLNLALSFQAAYAAPIIMMSQNRQADIDRKAAENDYQVNIKAELEIEMLHHKLDSLREQEVLALTKAVEDLSALIARHELIDRADTHKPAG